MSGLKAFFAGVLAILILFVSTNNVAFAANAEAEAYNLKGVEYYNSGEYQKSVEEFIKAINIDDTNPLYYANRGWSNWKLQNFDDAERDFNKAIQLDEHFANAYAGLAWMYKEQGKIKDSVDNFVKAAINYYNNKQYDNAKIDFEHALELDPNCEEARHYLEILNGTEPPPDTNEGNGDDTGTTIDPSKPEYHYQMGLTARYENNDAENALKHFTKAIELKPDYIAAYAERAKVYSEHFKDYVKAYLDYREIIRIDDFKKELPEEQRAEYEHKKKICWEELNFIEKFMVTFPDFFKNLDDLSIALLILMFINYVLEFVGDKILNGINPTLIVLVKRLLGKGILLLSIWFMALLDNKLTGSSSFSEYFTMLVFLYEFLYALNNADRAGIPIPDWLMALVKKIISTIEGFFQNFGGRRNNEQQ
ncbi:MAG: tetratricopeptide repeat protein [Selenomonadaceae bacterium]|nr:tetratricopeptide repeat protein [Selenomonadaceae bacterium]